MEFFLVRTGKNGPEKTPYLDTFHAVDIAGCFLVILVQFHDKNLPSTENISAILKINIALESLIIYLKIIFPKCEPYLRWR